MPRIAALTLVEAAAAACLGSLAETHAGCPCRHVMHGPHIPEGRRGDKGPKTDTDQRVAALQSQAQKERKGRKKEGRGGGEHTDRQTQTDRQTHTHTKTHPHQHIKPCCNTYCELAPHGRSDGLALHRPLARCVRPIGLATQDGDGVAHDAHATATRDREHVLPGGKVALSKHFDLPNDKQGCACVCHGDLKTRLYPASHRITTTPAHQHTTTHLVDAAKGALVRPQLQIRFAAHVCDRWPTHASGGRVCVVSHRVAKLILMGA